MAARAGQAVGGQPRGELGVARLPVHHGGGRGVHGGLLRGVISLGSETFAKRRDVRSMQEATLLAFPQQRPSLLMDHFSERLRRGDVLDVGIDAQPPRGSRASDWTPLRSFSLDRDAM